MAGFGRAEIERLIPHRRTMLLLTRVVEVEASHHIVAEYEIGPDNVFVDGHFDAPTGPIFPGVMQLECAAQAAAVLTSFSERLDASTAGYLFAGVSELKWHAPVVPPCMLRVSVQQQGVKFDLFKFVAQAHVGEALVMDATFTAKLIRKG